MLKRREQPICACCGQRLLTRHGVKLSPILADLLDMIERCDGVDSAQLAGVFYPDKSDYDGRNCVRANVTHLNLKLAETDVEIRAAATDSKRSPYRVIKRKNP